MLSDLKKGKIWWFTLVETILVCVVFAIFVSGIVLAINRAFNFMNNTRLSVRATNFAREWVELMYNIRDTNRRRCSWKKDNAWLYIGTWWDSSDECDYSDLFGSWIYILKEGINDNNDKYIYATKLEPTSVDEFYSFEWFFKDSYDSQRNQAKLSFTWTYKYLSWTDILTWDISELLWNWVDFYRIVRVYGIYKKNEANPTALATNLKNKDPKEMRFCVKVLYESNGSKHENELCSIMTNFKE